MSLRSLVLSLLLAAPLAAGAQQINSGYRIEGSGPARPVQVFDDGQQVYVQLRDPAVVPAAIGADGPLMFQMRGHYMVLPLVRSFRLHLGESIVTVAGRGASRLPEGVVSMTRPVEAVELPVEPVLPPMSQQPLPQAAPMASPRPVASDEVTGEIEVAGEPVRLGGNGRRVPVGAADDVIRRVLMDVPASTPLIVRGDGTVEGANTVRRVMRVCEWAGRACTLDYQGAPRGHVEVEPRA